jgi:prephenate dehydrogenase
MWWGIASPSERSLGTLDAVKKMSSADKKARTVAPSVPASQRKAVVAQATSRTTAKSAVTGRYATKATTTKAAKKAHPHRVA